MTEQKITFQIINHRDGSRTNAMCATMREVFDTIKEIELDKTDDGPSAKDYLLIIAFSDQQQFSTAPLVTLETYIALEDQVEWNSEEKH